MSLIVRLVGQKTGDGLVEVGNRGAISNGYVGVSDLGSNERVDVGKSLVGITTSEVTEVPVLLNSGER